MRLPFFYSLRRGSDDELRWVAWANLFARGRSIADTGKLSLAHATRLTARPCHSKMARVFHIALGRRYHLVDEPDDAKRGGFAVQIRHPGNQTASKDISRGTRRGGGELGSNARTT